MLEFFSTERGNAIPITMVRRESLPAWLETHPQSRGWIEAVGFKAEPGTFAFVPDANGRPAAVLAAPADGETVWALAGLPMSLPEGSYVLEAGDDDIPHSDLALGWALGSYAFTRYRKARRAGAMLVWPGRADRDDVLRIATGVFLARDLINTPAEDMGPEHLADAALAVANTHGARSR